MRRIICLLNILSHHYLLNPPYLFLDLDFSCVFSLIKIEVILPKYSSETYITSCNLSECLLPPTVI